MALVVSNAGELNIIDAFLSDIGSEWYYKLYKNDVTPDENTAVGAFTLANFSGFVETVGDIMGQGYAWNTATTVDDKAESFLDNDMVWEHDGGATANDIYGYFVINGAGALVFSERFTSAPLNLSSNGDKITLTPKFTVQTEFGQV